MNNKKKNEGQTDFSYYGLYLLDYLRTNRFEQASDDAFIRERADRAAETYERVRLEGYPPEGAQELAMDTLLRGLRYSKYAILREVVENEFANEVPEKKREAFIRKLLPPVGNVFSAYDWKSHATLTLLATQDLPTFGYNMIDPLKSWCWGSILFYPFKISRFS